MSADGLAGRVAVVTGALGILGPVWTEALAGAGATVIGIDVREGDGVVQADVTDRASLERVLADVVREHGPPAVLVNNAGIDVPPGDRTTTRRSRRTLEVNVAGVFNATEVFGRAMCDAGQRLDRQHRLALRLGRADPGALRPHRAPVHEAGRLRRLEGGGRQPDALLRAALGPLGVRVNALLPGGVRGGQDDEFVRKYSERVPLGRMAEPGDLVGPLLFLASDASAYVTGPSSR